MKDSQLEGNKFLSRNYIIQKTKILYAFFWIVILLSQVGCENTCDGCGGCTYKNYKEEVIVSKVDSSSGKIEKIVFKTQSSSPEEFILNEDDLRILEKEITKKMLASSSYFLLEGEIIEKGSCQPYVVKKISTILK